MKSVAIIGGGPAGSMAAEPLARGGFTVTVFEEKPGWEKPCGGGLSYKAVQRYPFVERATERGRRIADMEFIAPNGDSVRFSSRKPLMIYSRSGLNSLLLERAKEAGAEITHDHIFRVRREGGGWILQGREASFSADYLIIAGGARTRLRQDLAGDFRREDYLLTYGYYVPGNDSLLRIKFFDDYEGYAWAFPRLDHLSVGIGGKASEENMAGLRDRLHGFMKEYGYPTDGPIFAHLLPALSIAAWKALTLSGDGWMLVGDAAGLVDPVTGEGIYYAMRSGEIGAESLIAGVPAEYEKRVRKEIVEDLLFGAHLAPHFFHSRIMGQSVTHRLVQLAKHSKLVMDTLQDLIGGAQSYAGLGNRLTGGIAASPVGFLLGSFREVLNRPYAQLS
jgi:geranylgeranyl diphosphate/geranylgeranyl-bacteriochlorophyllide a reductase